MCHFLQQNTNTSAWCNSNKKKSVKSDYWGFVYFTFYVSVLKNDKRDISTKDNRDKYQEGFSTDFYGIKLKRLP